VVGPIIGSETALAPRLVMYTLLIFVFITGPLAASRSKSELFFTAVLGVAMLLSGLSSSLLDNATSFSFVLGVVFFAYLTYLIARDLLTVTTDVNTDTLWMAVNVYILSGIFFSFLYACIAIYDHGAFTGKFMDIPLRDQIYGFIYFSFVTLTTLGYGDVTPNNTTVSTLTYMEALFGQLFLAIMVARLVGLYATRSTRE
jgi:hypothetical protein